MTDQYNENNNPGIPYEERLRIYKEQKKREEKK